MSSVLVRRLRRGAKFTAIVLAVLVAVGLIVGTVLQARYDDAVRAENPPPGEFVDVGEHRLHYRLLGTGDPTFVLEAGAGEYGSSWRGLADSLATLGRVFAYDRAGYGWSEEGPEPRTVQRLADELDRALDGAGVPPPYILVGHSLGGAIATLYATEHPEKVRGLLLVDPSHRDQGERLPIPGWMEFVFASFLRLAPTGIPRLLVASDDPIQGTTRHVSTLGAEFRAIEESVEAWGNAPIDLGRTPIYVITAADPERKPGGDEAAKREWFGAWRQMHAELVAASASEVRRHIEADDAGHYVHVERPGVVMDAARELVARTGDEVATPAEADTLSP